MFLGSLWTEVQSFNIQIFRPFCSDSVFRKYLAAKKISKLRTSIAQLIILHRGYERLINVIYEDKLTQLDTHYSAMFGLLSD